MHLPSARLQFLPKSAFWGGRVGVGVGGASIGSSEKRMEQELIGLCQKRGMGTRMT